MKQQRAYEFDNRDSAQMYEYLETRIETLKSRIMKNNRVKNNRGFSLFELLIVVAIILTIATMAIPSLLRARQAANESAAVADLRNINTAEITYLASNGGNYGSLPELVTAGLVDVRFGSGNAISGYNFAITASASDYTATAHPNSANSGRYAYYSLPDAVIRYQTGSGCGGPAGNCFPTGMSNQPIQ